VFGVCISDPQASGTKVWVHRQEPFAEYVCVPEATLSMKPENVTFEQAASAPVACEAAFPEFLGRVASGQLLPRDRLEREIALARESVHLGVTQKQ
jgi:hypothetical protein